MDAILGIPGWLIAMAISLIVSIVSFVVTNWWQSAIGLFAVLFYCKRVIEPWVARNDFAVTFGAYPCKRWEAGFLVMQKLVDQELLFRARAAKENEDALNGVLREYQLGKARGSRKDYVRVQELSEERQAWLRAFERARRLARRHGFAVLATLDEYIQREREEVRRQQEAERRQQPKNKLADLLPPSRLRRTS